MNFRKAIAKLEKRLKWIDKEIKDAQTIQNRGELLPEGMLDRLVVRHQKTVEQLNDLERIIKNRIFQWYGLEYYHELEREIEAEYQEMELENED